MIEAAAINAVMRALADPTRRAVFERIAGSDEITVVELTRGSGVTQGAISQHLKSLKQAGLVAERPEGRNVYLPRPAGRPRAAGRLDEPLRRLLARAVRQPAHPSQGNRSMNDNPGLTHEQAALTSYAGHRGRRGLSACAGDDLEGADHGRAHRPLADAGRRFRASRGQPLHLQDDAGRRLGRHDPLRGTGGRCRTNASSIPGRAGTRTNVGYGSRLETVVIWTLARVENGTRVRVVHSGFVLPRNDTAYRNMSDGLDEGRPQSGCVAAEQGSARKPN